ASALSGTLLTAAPPHFPAGAAPRSGVRRLAGRRAPQRVEVAPPQVLGGLSVAVRQLAQPGGDRPFAGHLLGPLPSGMPLFCQPGPPKATPRAAGACSRDGLLRPPFSWPRPSADGHLPGKARLRQSYGTTPEVRRANQWPHR